MSMKGTFWLRRCWFMEPCKGWAEDIEQAYLLEHDLRANAYGVCREGKPLHTFPDHALTDDAARPLARRRTRRGVRRIFEATDCDFEAGDAFVTGHRRHLTAHGAQERDQLGAQRLVMTDRQMAHRVAAVRLEAETFRHLAGQKVTHHILAARCDRDVAGLERR